MFCGTANFKNMHKDDDDKWKPCSLPNSPRKEIKKANKNPYSLRGLDKYSELIAELEARRAEVMENIGSQEVSMVRFMYSGSNDWVPIVINLKDVKQNDGKKKVAQTPSAALTNNSSESVDQLEEVTSLPRAVDHTESHTSKTTVSERPNMKKSFSWGAKQNCRFPLYWPIVIVMILLCLVMFGRVFAICCISILWYLVPIFQGDDELAASNARKSFKKNYVKKLSLQEVSSPKGRVSLKRGS